MEQNSKVKTALFSNPRAEWLALVEEEIVEPSRVIVDPHHHLWERPGSRYLADDFLADASSGHAVSASVFVECKSSYRQQGPANRRSLGEVEFASDIAEAAAASGSIGICRGIVAGTDFRALGQESEEIFNSFLKLGKGRLRGFRQPSSWTENAAISSIFPDMPRYLLLDERFRDGFSGLGRLGLSFDAFLFHPQIPDLIDLANAFPETKIVLDHLGGPLAIASAGDLRREVFDDWLAAIRELSRCANVSIKLGGLGMNYPGFDFHLRERPPGSDELARCWRPLIDAAIEAFGTKRSMFESNFPPDKSTCSYQVLWNAFKKITASFSEDEKNDLFNGTATAFYRL